MSERAVPKSEKGFTYLELDGDLVEEFNAYDPVHGPTVKNLYKNSKAHQWCPGIGAGVTGIGFWRSFDTIDSKLLNTKIVKGFIRWIDSMESTLPKTQRVKGIVQFRLILCTAGIVGTFAGAALGLEVAKKWCSKQRLNITTGWKTELQQSLDLNSNRKLLSNNIIS